MMLVQLKRDNALLMNALQAAHGGRGGLESTTPMISEVKIVSFVVTHLPQRLGGLSSSSSNIWCRRRCTRSFPERGVLWAPPAAAYRIWDQQPVHLRLLAVSLRIYSLLEGLSSRRENRCIFPWPRQPPKKKTGRIGICRKQATWVRNDVGLNSRFKFQHTSLLFFPSPFNYKERPNGMRVLLFASALFEMIKFRVPGFG